MLAREVAALRELSYEELRALLDVQDTHEVAAESGTWYQVETQVWWDDKPGGDLRVRTAIDDGGWRAYIPMTDDFIKAPDGSFVGE